MKSVVKLVHAAGDLGQLAINKAVKNFIKRLDAYAKASGGHFMFSQSLANCSLCCSNDNVFFLQHKHCAPFVLHTFCCMWTWEMMMWLKKKSNNFVVVAGNEMPFGTFTW